MKNAFVLFYLLLIASWGLFSVFAAAASADVGQPSINNTWDGDSFNASSASSGVNEGISFIEALVSFHTEVFWIDLFLGILGVFFIWVVASTFFGIGGGGG